MRFVSAASPAPQVNVSNDHSRALVSPPKPAQRAIGRKKSNPPSSAIRAALTLSGHVAFQRSGTVVRASPPSAFVEKTPSLKRAGPASGCVIRRKLGGLREDFRKRLPKPLHLLDRVVVD